jgi:hypothetical protein
MISKPKNEGRTFRAWCGGHYTFARGKDKKLHVLPYHDSWQFIDDWRAIEKAMIQGSDPYIGMTREMRLAEKVRTFHARYAGIRDHSWKDRPPDVEGTITGRMTVSKPPFQF